jgi:hypothetical protein
MPKKAPTKAPSTRGRGRGRGRRIAAMTASHSQATASSAEESSSVDLAESDSQSVVSASQRDSSGRNKAKWSKLVRSDLTPEDEEAMVDWLREHPLLFNKKLTLYKDKGKKDALWAEQARLLEKDVVLLTVWYRSIRTRYGKLTKLKSGGGTGDRTERDLWILEKFDFLRSHIHEVQQRTIVSVSTIFVTNNMHNNIFRNFYVILFTYYSKLNHQFGDNHWSFLQLIRVCICVSVCTCICVSVCLWFCAL